MRNLPALVALALTLCGSGCTTFPELDRIAVDETAAKPALVPLEPLLDPAAVNRATPDAADHLTARAAALRARAAALQGRDTIDGDTRDRMATGVIPPG